MSETATQNPVPVSALASPEESLRFLFASTLGESAPAVLWWDGGQDSWVPWSWTGEAPGKAPEAGYDLSSSWGKFRVTGEGAAQANWNREALLRVSEDMALRDLMEWNRSAERLRSLPNPGVDASAGATEAWFSGVCDFLNPDLAMLWQTDKDGWSLMATRGSGVEFSGRLHLSDPVMQASFGAGESGWHVWNPQDRNRVTFRFPVQDARWPLRLSRVESVLNERTR